MKKSKVSKIPASDMMVGIKKARRMYRSTKMADAVKAMTDSKDPDLVKVLTAFDGTPEEFHAKLLKLKGPTTDSLIAKNFKFKAVADKTAVKKTVKKAEKKAKPDKKEASPSPVIAQDDEVEIEICAPLSVGCPDTNEKGEETHLVTTTDGFFACGSVKKDGEKEAK